MPRYKQKEPKLTNVESLVVSTLVDLGDGVNGEAIISSTPGLKKAGAYVVFRRMVTKGYLARAEGQVGVNRPTYSVTESGLSAFASFTPCWPDDSPPISAARPRDPWLSMCEVIPEKR